MSEKRENSVVLSLLDRGIFLSPDLKPKLADLNIDDMGKIDNTQISYINLDLLECLKNKDPEINWQEFEKIRFLAEKKGDIDSYEKFIDYIKKPNTRTEQSESKKVKIITSFQELSSKRDVQDFTLYFNTRLNSIQKILLARDELRGITTIGRLQNKKERENISIIGLIKQKHITKNGNLILALEDSTGEIKVLVNKNKPEIFDSAKDIVLDEVIGVSGVSGDNIIFANNVLWPDIPSTNELKKSDMEGYAIFLSDLHVGSKDFLSEDFERFLNWINLEAGNEKQKEIASKVKYIFIVGDLVDGVGIYPGQVDDLTITDIYEQYIECRNLLSRIPSNIELIICPGNHDAIRIAEPQPALLNEFCAPLKELKNATIVSNPSLVNIHSTKGFSGYDVLLYHGYSFDYYVANVDSIRNNGGYDRADLLMKFLLKRRHLAPTHASTLYVPTTDMDPLVISKIPDFFITGHIHKSAVSTYKNITLISGSCWQGKTAFQEKVGHHPEPSRVPIVDLSSRELKILRFGK